MRARLAAAVRAFSLARDTALDAEARWRVRVNSDVRRPEYKVVKHEARQAGELVETAVPKILVYYAFPEEHWRCSRDQQSSASCVRSAGEPAWWCLPRRLEQLRVPIPSGRPARAGDVVSA